MELSKSEEDYLKALYHLQVEGTGDKVSSKVLSEVLGVSAASVSGMLKKLKSKSLVIYEKYGKLGLSKKGMRTAVSLIRKHRLWETFLYDHMNFSWDEVHDVAEQLEHIHSEKLIEELDRFLGHPSRDPHGDPIPNADGKVSSGDSQVLSSLGVGNNCKLVSVNDTSVAFLRYVSDIGLALSDEIEVLEKRDFDNSMLIRFNDKQESVSETFADNVFVELKR